MRRGALNDSCRELGCNKLAWAPPGRRHRDPGLVHAVRGRIHTFHPVTYLSRTGITQIRPLCYLPEKHIVHMARVLSLPVVSSPCPVDSFTKRKEIKELLDQLCKQFPNARELLLSALRNQDQYGLWEKPARK